MGHRLAQLARVHSARTAGSRILHAGWWAGMEGRPRRATGSQHAPLTTWEAAPTAPRAPPRDRSLTPPPLPPQYWGGPTIGYNSTGKAVPNGARVLASFTGGAPLPAALPAAIAYEGRYVRALFNSPHPEAQAGVGLTCAPPLPRGCITPAQQLANWRWLAEQLNALLGEAWVVPTKL